MSRATELDRGVLRPVLRRYLREVLEENRGTELHPEELAREVRRRIRRDTDASVTVTSRMIGSFLQHHVEDEELDFVTREPQEQGDRYVYRLNNTDDEEVEGRA